MTSVALIRLNPRDSVGVASSHIRAGATLVGDFETLAARQDIPAGHKVALVNLAAGQPVVKYGEVIGLATQAILAGELVHLHNLTSALSLRRPQP